MASLRFNEEDFSELERLIKETRKHEDGYLDAIKAHAAPNGDQLNVEDVKELAKMRDSLKKVQKKRDLQYTQIWTHL